MSSAISTSMLRSRLSHPVLVVRSVCYVHLWLSQQVPRRISGEEDHIHLVGVAKEGANAGIRSGRHGFRLSGACGGGNRQRKCAVGEVAIRPDVILTSQCSATIAAKNYLSRHVVRVRHASRRHAFFSVEKTRASCSSRLDLTHYPTFTTDPDYTPW